MNFIRQATNECWVTSLAIVTNKNIELLRKEFTQDSPFDYQTLHVTESAKEWWARAERVLADNLHRRAAIHKRFRCVPSGAEVAVCTKLTPKALRGKGLLTVVFHAGRHAHTVAFSDGKIYDPNRPETASGYKLAAWRKFPSFKRLTTFRIDYYTTEAT